MNRASGGLTRTTGEHTGVVVDLGAFSRRRPLAEGAASRTVMG
uniref:Uncharacterized protein n=1 Tax=Streptomyces sp. NBC_01393 TaxID=2903851 RepID=A0AAU3I5Y0_9ACTN